MTPNEAKKARNDLRISQRQIARLMGVQQSNYCRWENGTRSFPSYGKRAEKALKAIVKESKGIEI